MLTDRRLTISNAELPMELRSITSNDLAVAQIHAVSRRSALSQGKFKLRKAAF